MGAVLLTNRNNHKQVASLPFTQDYLNRVAEGLDDLGLSP
jgi:hypothetical protein